MTASTYMDHQVLRPNTKTSRSLLTLKALIQLGMLGILRLETQSINKDLLATVQIMVVYLNKCSPLRSVSI